MIRSTTFTDGHMAGAARLGTCAVPLAPAGPAVRTPVLGHLAGIHVPMHDWQWIECAYAKRISRVFATDRPIPRPPERSP